MLARAHEPALLLIAPTGGGKTLAGFLPTLVELAAGPARGLHTLYVSPLKALAADIRRNLAPPSTEMGLPIRIEDRTGDTSRPRKPRQRADPPHILLTTPESLALLLSYEDAPRIFAGLRRVVVDEIHALAESKRGDQLMLALARLQALAPGLRRVGLSATVEDPPALAAFLARHPDPCEILHADPGPAPDIAMLETARPPPWAGGGGAMPSRRCWNDRRRHRTTLIFHNTRAQAEIFFHEPLAANDRGLPIGIHHGSARREARAGSRRRWPRANCGPSSAPAARPRHRLGRRGPRDPGRRAEERQAAGAADRPGEPPLQRAVEGAAGAGQPLRGGGMPRGARRGARGRSRRRAARAGAARRALPAHPAAACRRPFDADALFAEVTHAGPYAALPRADSTPASTSPPPGATRCAPMTAGSG
jgi:ATP-dependent helicase Lhr and Lhr-like helicase